MSAAYDVRLAARLDELMEYALSLGCPCRFPRVRAVTARDTRNAAGGAFTSADQRELIHAFERKVPIIEKRPLEIFQQVREGLWLGKCGKCGALLRRAYEEFSPGGTIDWLMITRAKDVPDLGAPLVDGRVLRCRPLEAPGPGMQGMAKASQVFPFLEEDEWFAWIRERAPDPARP